MRLQSFFNARPRKELLKGAIVVAFLFPFQDGLPIRLLPTGLSLYPLIMTAIKCFLFIKMCLRYSFLHLDSPVHQRTFIPSIFRMILFLDDLWSLGGIVLFFDLLDTLVGVCGCESVV